MAALVVDATPYAVARSYTTLLDTTDLGADRLGHRPHRAQARAAYIEAIDRLERHSERPTQAYRKVI